MAPIGRPKKRKAAVLEEVEGFAIECPAKPATLQNQETLDVAVETDNPGVSDLAITFAIRPGEKWTSTKSFRNVKYQNHLFKLGDHILVNRIDPPPRPPPQDASSEQVLKYHRENTWVGRIQQVKAQSEQEVLIRVFWLYWPEELPMGAQSYHGRSELVMSNYTDIIDATTIAGPVDISEWEEWDDTLDERPLNALFWRQTFDVSKLGKNKTGGLSRLRTHCICQEEYNPDTTMYQCPADDCKTWSHAGCLRMKLIEDLWQKLQNSTLEQFLDQNAAALEREKEDKKSLGEALVGGVEKAVANVIQLIDGGSGGPHDLSGDNTTSVKKTRTNDRRSEPPEDLSGDHTTRRPTKTTQQTAAHIVRDDRVQAVIESIDIAGSSTVVAKVQLKPEKGNQKAKTRGWTIKLDCLECGKPLD